MTDELKINTVRVFVNSRNQFGNPVGVIINEQKSLDTVRRQAIAKELNFSETVFINDISNGNVNIFNPIREVKFAGHALVGTAWFINKINKKPPNSLTCSGEVISTRQEDDFTWIRAKLAITPPWNHEQLKDIYSLENLTKEQISSKEHTIVWTWLDKNKRIIRARTFAPDWGILEDEANGSGAMQLAAQIGYEIQVIHGKGSEIYAKPLGLGFVEVGGRVKEK